MNRLLSTAAVAAMLSFTALHGAQARESKLGTADLAFVLNAAAGGMEEVALGKLAAKQAGTSEVRKFGEQMVTEHMAANKKLMAIAKEKDVDLPDGLSPATKMIESDLAGKEGSGFDKQYVAEQAAAHGMVLAAFRFAAEHAIDPDVKSFAKETVGTIKQHDDMLQKMMQAQS